jgi:hypothetical protein
MVANAVDWGYVLCFYHDHWVLRVSVDLAAETKPTDHPRSFIDALMSMPLGMALVGIQMLAARNDMFSNV